jgi:integrase/recombinase XerD
VHTRRAYNTDITAWLAFCADHNVDPLANVRRSHVDAWARTLEATGYRPRTVARKIASVSSWYRFP